MRLFLDAAVTALPSTVPLWFILAVSVTVAALAVAVGFLIVRIRNEDSATDSDGEDGTRKEL